jgi:hypothetical protein
MDLRDEDFELVPVPTLAFGSLRLAPRVSVKCVWFQTFNIPRLLISLDSTLASRDAYSVLDNSMDDMHFITIRAKHGVGSKTRSPREFRGNVSILV